MTEQTPSNAVGLNAAPRLPRRCAFLVTAALGLYIALGEIDRLIGMSPSDDGYTISLASVSSLRMPFPGPDPSEYPWAALQEIVAADTQVAGLINAYLALDLLFAAVIAALLHRALRAACRIDCEPRPGWLPFLTVPTTYLAFVVFAADTSENVLLFTIAQVCADGGVAAQALLTATVVATFVKWLVIGVALLQIGHSVLGSGAGRERLMIGLRGLSAQRYSVLALLPIAGLGLIPGSGILDQLPDVQRAWFGTERMDRGGAAIAAALLVMVCLGLLLLGRLVADSVYHRVREVKQELYGGTVPHRPAPPLWLWLYGPGLLGLGLVAAWMTSVGPIRWLPFGVFAAVPLGIVGLSAFVQWHKLDTEIPDQRIYSKEEFRSVVMTGDALALAGLTIGALVLIRSHTAFLALHEGTAFQQALPVISFVVALAIWWVGPPWLAAAIGRSSNGPLGRMHRWITGRTAMSASAAPGEVRRWVRGIAIFFVLISTAGLLAVGLWPVGITGAIGVVASVLLAVALVALLVGSTVVLHLHYAPPQIFWWGPLRLREAPVATLLVVTVLATLILGSDHTVHGVRGSRDVASAAGAANGVFGARQRPDMSTLFADWEQRTRECDFAVTAAHDGQRRRIRPMLMVAAEGGGIRAAYWTSATLDVLKAVTTDAAATGDAPAVTGCGLDSVIIASGVSGGAVGLAVSRFADTSVTAEHPDGHPAADAVWALGSPDALAQGTVGLLGRDPIYSVTGLALGSDVPQSAESGWIDRAGLMEVSWETDVPELAGDFFNPPTRDDGNLGSALVLGSTATATGCRVLVSHVETRGAPLDDCAGPSASAAYSLDFATSFMGEQDSDRMGEHCVDRLSASTAAMLAARFPYVTPSGVVGPCGRAPRAQLIDGGYAEGSGVG
ncbi:MAG: hypothetical protein WBG57_11225, partial [Ornithinimicrobium sp.]